MFHVVALRAETQAYNQHYAQAVANVARNRRITEGLLTWAHLVSHTIVIGEGRSPFDTTARAQAERACHRCGGTGFTSFTWVEAGRCFACNFDTRSIAKKGN